MSAGGEFASPQPAPLQQGASPAAPPARSRRSFSLSGLFQGAVRIRAKLILMHTVFCAGLSIALLLALHAPVRDLLAESEERECVLALEWWRVDPAGAERTALAGVEFAHGSAAELGLSPDIAELARAQPERAITARSDGLFDPAPVAVLWSPADGRYHRALVRSPEARAAINRLFMLLTIAVLGVYATIALVLEVFVLPRHVYGPIERLRRADEAVQRGWPAGELIPESQMPSDELGDIMRSRNASILALRRQERALGDALARLEAVAGELARKNHLLEMAQRNLADQDRLVSLGILSAGIAHEINTPLAVVKGCVQRLGESSAQPPDPAMVALMTRVVNRLERVKDSLLDFARVRPPTTAPVNLRECIDEAWTLVSLDRNADAVALHNRVPAALIAPADGDRMVQVFVNLLRNAVDAMNGAGEIEAEAEFIEREGARWVSVALRDTGPGIDPALMPRLFEPFATTRLDDKGTGLGLAVAQGIVREHGGLLVARNQPGGGAVFEVLLPL